MNRQIGGNALTSNPTSDSEIEFGDLQGRKSVQRLRPDRDGQFAVVAVGEPQAGELPIFVDLDVMRDMEAHALTNTDVELGGVLLGWQAKDDSGQPFVQIVDSLRAEHYEATRGSFKFTHETWSEFTRRRQSLHPDLQLVGWYHTHPGWGVFLSEMDRFICDHFFSSSEDVALVIDPRQQTRGWFQWQTGRRLAQLSGWRIYAHRHRAGEIEYYSRLYSGTPMPHFDPRYAVQPNVGPTSVQVIEHRQSSQLHLVGWVLTGLQTLALLFVCIWFTTTNPANSLPSQPEKRSFNRAAEDELIAATARCEIYRDLINQLTGLEGHSIDLPKLFAESQLENEQLTAANRSHINRIAELEGKLSEESQRVHRLNENLQNAQATLETTDKSQPASKFDVRPEDVSRNSLLASGWMLPSIVSAFVIVVGCLVASLLRGARLARELEQKSFRPIERTSEFKKSSSTSSTESPANERPFPSG